MKPRLLIAAAVISVALAVPLCVALTKSSDLLKVERSKSNNLQLQLNSDQKIKDAQQKQIEIEQQKNKELQQQIQTKADAAEAVKKQQATVAYMSTPHCDAYLSLIQKYDWPVQTAVAIMKAESGCRAITPSNAAINYDDVPDYGLFQLHGIDVTDPAENVRIAYTVKYLPSHSFAAWNTYTSGRYLSFLQ